MEDPRVEALAKVLVEYSVDARPGQLIQIKGSPEGTPLLLKIYQRVLERAAHPWLNISLQDTEEILYAYGDDAQLNYFPPCIKDAIEKIDAVICVRSAVNTKRFSNVDPVKQSHRAAVIGSRCELSTKHSIRRVSALYPTQALAQDANMSLCEFEKFVFKGCRIGGPEDPITAWKAFSRKQRRLVDWLTGKEKIHVIALDTDLSMSVKGRKWTNCDGHENLPDGEISTGPVEDSVNGHVRFSHPTCFFGREVEDIRLWFEKGKVVRATAAKNESFLLEMLRTDDGACCVGEFAVGTNPDIQVFTKNILLDEKIEGTFHIALGRGFPTEGSKNKSAIHWDMICDLRQGGTIHVDDILFSEDGKAVI